MGSCGVWLGNICLNAVRAVATIFSYSKSCVCPCEFCLGGQSQIWRDAAKLSTYIFFLSEGRHHSSSVGNAMLLTSSDKDTWCSLVCRMAMFHRERWDVFEGYHGRLPPPPERAQSWLLESWSWGCEGLHSLKHEELEMHSSLILSLFLFFFFLMEQEQSLNKTGFIKKLPVTLVKLCLPHPCIKKR